MMKCEKCLNNAVISNPVLCKTHFISYFEEKVNFTIKKFKLLKKKGKIAVAVSGGKDSMSLLYLLKKFSYNVYALAVDEGILGYRDRTLINMKKFCIKNKIPYKIISFKEKFGQRLDDIVKNNKILPCSVCGVFRRRILDVHSRGFDVLATGHNMDDEAQAVLMNLAKNNISLLSRLGPISGKKRKKEFTMRVKPFYFCSEKEIMVYSFINRINADFEECPNVPMSFRLRIRGMLNDIEHERYGAKRNVIDTFQALSIKTTKDDEKQKFCIYCHEPSSKEICSACMYVKTLKTTTI